MILPFRTPTFTIELMAPHITITLDTPSKGDFYMLMTEDGKSQYFSLNASADIVKPVKQIEYRETGYEEKADEGLTDDAVNDSI